MSLSQHPVWLARALKSFVPSTCRFLSPEDVTPTGSYPMAAGGFADIWEATYERRKVALKCYRYHSTSNVAHIIERFCNEVRACSLLHHTDVEVVPFLGIYSTEARPFCLVYEHMGCLDVRQYLRNEPDISARLKLLADIAQGLNLLHDLGIVHGCFQSTNILVGKDGALRIGGLGNVYILPHSAAWAVEDGVSTDRLFRSRAVAGLGLSPNVSDSVQPTKTGDVYSFGVLAFEILTGRPPFFDLPEVAAMCSMLKGSRPLRPNDCEIPDCLWHMVEQCWDIAPSQRMPIGEAANLLQAELRRTADS